jgi:hypothetical protein
MPKIKLTILLLSFFFITAFTSSVQAVNLCSYQGINTTSNIRNQISYPEEKFIGIASTSLGQLNNLSQLKGLTCLQYIDFYKSEIKGDLANLNNLTDLRVLNMNENPGIYGDICALSKATNLRALRVAFNPKVTGNTSCLTNLTLDTFAATGTQITGDLSDFSHMSNLKELYLGGTQVKGDVASLSKLTKMKELVISNSEEERPKIYGDLSTLKNLNKPWRVSIYNTNTTNCEQFTKNHPDIMEGGCSQLSKSSPTDPQYKPPQKNKINVILTITALSSLILIVVIILKSRRK